VDAGRTRELENSAFFSPNLLFKQYTILTRENNRLMTAQLLSYVALFVFGLLALRGVVAYPVARALSRRDLLATAALSGAYPLDAQAAPPPLSPDRATAAKFFFNGVYRDNKHPGGYRIVEGGGNRAGTGTVTLKDTLDGRAFEAPMTARRDEATGQLSLSMDLSSYGETLPDDDAPIWWQANQNPKLTKTVVAAVDEKDGSIRFPDGNVWRKEGGLVGVYIDGFAPYPKFRRLVLPGKDQTLSSVVMMRGSRIIEEKGVDLSVVMVSGKKVIEVSGVDLGRRGLQVQFPGKQCGGMVDRKRGTIAWADGNVWTKV